MLRAPLAALKGVAPQPAFCFYIRCDFSRVFRDRDRTELPASKVPPFENRERWRNLGLGTNKRVASPLHPPEAYETNRSVASWACSPRVIAEKNTGTY